ncbi:MAG: TIGR02444 family protein [Rhodospirillales bacterium]|nr:TIGR02444 family protein [Rhodospirillales bacterium]
METVTEKRAPRNQGLWAFAVALYAAPGVKAQCLALQERHRADVPLLLAAVWHGASGRGGLSPRRAALWRAISRRWRTRVILRLRAARNAIRIAARTDPAIARLRRSILDAELEAERRCLAELEAAAMKISRPCMRQCGIRALTSARPFVRGRSASARLTKIISALDAIAANQRAGQRIAR